MSPSLLKSLVARPSLVAGDKYGKVSQAYSSAVNAVLRKKIDADQALTELERKLVQITGFPAVSN